jgi:WD40 repeat protein
MLQVTTLRGHSNVVKSVVFSLDGKRVVSGSDDTLVKLWDAEARAEVSTRKTSIISLFCPLHGPRSFFGFSAS